MKKETITLVGIAACILLLTSPVLASAGYSKIYGNANEDDTLDMRDVTYIKLAIFGKKPATTFADANHDGKISMLDVGQTKLIILGKEKQLTLVDQADRKVTVPRPIERVVSSSPDCLRTIASLGGADKHVGVSSYIAEYGWRMPAVIAYPGLKELPGVGIYGELNAEQMLSLKPDVIFAWAYGGPDAANTLQEKTGIPVVAVVRASIDQLKNFEIYQVVGKVMGKEKEAEELTSYFNKRRDELIEVTTDVPESEKPKVYLVFWSQITHTPVFYDPVDLAGGINVAKDLAPTTHHGAATIVSKEQIIAWNPDIILIHGVFPPHKISIEDILSDPDLQTINAVKNRKVYYTNGFMIGWDPAVGFTETFYMAKLFHPDKFSDLDMEKEGNEILKRVYGADSLYTGMLENSDLHRWE
jgi:iron complex transport system substrate-binding protein